MKPSEFFRFCPRCGTGPHPPPTSNAFACPSCRFRYFFNPAVAAAVFVRRADGGVLLIRRAKDPGKGRLAPPGGFIDHGETAETAAAREIREEVGLEIRQVRFLCSQPNAYHYGEVTYPVLDLFFTAWAADGAQARVIEEVESLEWVEPASVVPEDLAFPSMQAAWRLWRDSDFGAGRQPVDV
jgi:NAD+ diphosphatase